MRARLAIIAAFLVMMVAPATAQEFCAIKSIPIAKFNCDKGLIYVGPRNKFKYGGQCLYPLQKCLEKVEPSADGKCVGGTFVGSPKAVQYGGQCLTPAPGWQIQTRVVDGPTDCKDKEIYMGGAKKGLLGGHCVKIFK